MDNLPNMMNGLPMQPDEDIEKGNDRKIPISVVKDDLPFSCPPADSDNWNYHPRVFLDFNADGQAQCPYCGARYRLI